MKRHLGETRSNVCPKIPPGTPPRGLSFTLPLVPGALFAGQRKLFPHHGSVPLSQRVIPRQPGKCRLRMASGHFYLSMNHPAGFYPVPQDQQYTLILDGEFIFSTCTSIVYRASLIK